MNARRYWRDGMMAALLLHSAAAGAFAEDVCPAEDGGWTHCSRRPCDPESAGAGCETVAMLTTVRAQRGASAVGARSTVHFDATYYLAQAAGFSPRAAMAIAVHNEAVDVGRFWLRGEDGRLLVAPQRCESSAPPALCALSSRAIDGTNRNDFSGGGVFFHFMPPAAGQVFVDGLSPAVRAPRQEPMLAHMHRWVEGEGPLCVGGLTEQSADGDYATGARCYRSPTRPQNLLVGRMPFVNELGFVGSVDWTATIREQGIAPQGEDGPPRAASQLARQLGHALAPLVRLGIYLHAVQDRVSHHRCLDVSSVQGPRAADAGELRLNPVPYALYQLSMNVGSMAGVREQLAHAKAKADPAFVFEFDREQCDQPNHALRHTWETGYPQDQLELQDRTTEPALLLSLQLLQAFSPVDVPSLDRAAREQLVGAVVAALEEPDPNARVAALGQLAEDQGWLPLPGHPGVDVASWLAKAGEL